MMEAIFERLKQIITEEMGVDASDIDLDQEFKDLDLDSLDLVDIVCGVEDEYEIVIGDSELLQLETPRDLINLICKKKGWDA